MLIPCTYCVPCAQCTPVLISNGYNPFPYASMHPIRTIFIEHWIFGPRSPPSSTTSTTLAHTCSPMETTPNCKWHRKKGAMKIQTGREVDLLTAPLWKSWQVQASKQEAVRREVGIGQTAANSNCLYTPHAGPMQTPCAGQGTHQLILLLFICVFLAEADVVPHMTRMHQPKPFETVQRHKLQQ